MLKSLSSDLGFDAEMDPKIRHALFLLLFKSGGKYNLLPELFDALGVDPELMFRVLNMFEGTTIEFPSIDKTNRYLRDLDIYKKLKPEASERTLVSVGRLATGVVVVSGIFWIPFMKYISGELYHYIQSVQAYIAPPIAAVFLLPSISMISPSFTPIFFISLADIRTMPRPKSLRSVSSPTFSFISSAIINHLLF